MKKYILHTIFIFVWASFLAGCSTEKNTRASRAYHNVTSHYNIYFNANESVKYGENNIEESIENDFTRVLPIYKSSDPSAANLVKSDMENAIIKCSKLIELHSITKKPKRKRRRTRRYQEFASQEEFNKWIDDSYFLMGKAYFYQHNYFAAIDNFSYVVRKYPDDNARYESEIWLIRSYTEMERYVEAAEVIQSIQNADDFPRKLEKDLATATAFYYLKQGELDEAIKYLNIAIKKILLRRNKARLQYIVAQLHQELGNDNEASQAFRAVTRMNPGYSMAFNAKINSAGVFAEGADPEKLKKELRKMLRDRKNIDFRDQIYYALGNVYFREGNRNQAIENYRNSVSSSFQNQFQRAQSAITLADLYFEDLKYREAQAYYDSAMIIIDETYPNYEVLEGKYSSLTNLVENIQLVEREDSLQKIALMPEREREGLIARLMREEQERQRQAENLALQGSQGQGYYRANRYRMGMGNRQSGAGWYFYNPQTVSYGRVTFQQQWGKRRLEDNWRRSNKNAISEIGEEEMLAEEVIEKREEDPLKKEFYTQDLPLTDSLMQESHNRIRDALYNTGKIFKSEFADYPRSIEAFEELIERYPNNIYILSAYFDLYDLYELVSNPTLSGNYRNLIITGFPNSKFAQYLQNPNFFVEMEAQQDSLNNLYQQTFRSYKSGRYRNVLALSTQMKKMTSDSTVIPKIDFMETVAKGTQTDLNGFESLLNDYVQKYPTKEPTPLAKEILSLIQDSTLADYQQLVDMGYISEEIENEELLPENRLENDEFGGKFTYEEDLLHYFVIAYPRDANIDLNRLKFDIANYNIDHYTKVDFDIETDILDEKLSFLLVRAMENKESGIIYHRAIIRRAAVFTALQDLDYLNFVISSTNYRAIKAERSIGDYLKFFVKNYSRYIKSDFSDEESEVSPEELMARAREEDEILQERGEFVVVKTGAEKLFNTDVDTTQNFVIAIQDKKISTRQLLNGFSEFNRDQFRAWNLALQLKETDNYRLLVIKGIPSLKESFSYFGRVIPTRKLFTPLGQTSYKNFIATDENLQKMLEQNNVDEYLGFFRANYLARRNDQSTTPAPAKAQPTPVAPVSSPEEKTEAYSGPYNPDIAGAHYFVFVIPRLNIDQPAFVSGLEQFNEANYASQELKLDISALDDIRQVVRISGLPDLEMARSYFSKVVNNRGLFTPLRQGEYRNFIISESNYDVFLNKRNIREYMDFYKSIYLQKQ